MTEMLEEAAQLQRGLEAVGLEAGACEMDAKRSGMGVDTFSPRAKLFVVEARGRLEALEAQRVTVARATAPAPPGRDGA